MSSRKAWATEEIAFIIAHTDYCIYHDLKYETTVTDKLVKLFARTVTWNTIRAKLEKLFKNYGVKNPSVRQFKTQGTGYLGDVVIPAEVRSEIDILRQAWELPRPLADPASHPPIAGDDSSRPVEDDGAERPAARDAVGLQEFIDHRSEMRGIQETPEILATDGALDQPSWSPLSTPSSLEFSSPAVKKKRAATPEDVNDLDYRPSPERIELVARPSHRAAIKAPRGSRGTSTTKDAEFFEKEAPKTRATAQSQRERSVITIDDLPRDFRAAASYSRGDALVKQARDQHQSKRKVELISEPERTTTQPSRKRQQTEGLTLGSVNEKIDACLSMIGSMANHRQNMTEEASEHLYQIIRTLKDPEGSFVDHLIKDLQSHRMLKEKYRSMVQKLVEFVDLNNGIVFPKEPQQEEVSRSWSAFYEHVVSIVGPNNTTPKISAVKAAYFAASAENIAFGRIPDKQLDSYMESLSTLLQSPQAQQTLFGALICRYTFTGPESMLHAMHSDGMLHLYDGILHSASTPTAGLAHVQRYDKVAARLLFQDPAFQKIEVERRVTELKHSLQAPKDKFCQESRIPSCWSPTKFVREVIALKQQLLLSPKNYRIHYVRPTSAFDPSWMQAFDCENNSIPDATASGKKVAMCLFPALTCEKGEATKADAEIEDVLVKNKRFFPTFLEMTCFEPSTQLSKAAVLIFWNETGGG